MRRVTFPPVLLQALPLPCLHIFHWVPPHVLAQSLRTWFQRYTCPRVHARDWHCCHCCPPGRRRPMRPAQPGQDAESAIRVRAPTLLRNGAVTLSSPEQGQSGNLPLTAADHPHWDVSPRPWRAMLLKEASLDWPLAERSPWGRRSSAPLCHHLGKASARVTHTQSCGHTWLGPRLLRTLKSHPIPTAQT